MAEEEARPFKRRRVGATDGSEAVTSPQPGTHEQEQEPIRHLLYVRWFGGQGQTKLNKLPLKQIDTLEALEVGWQQHVCWAPASVTDVWHPVWRHCCACLGTVTVPGIQAAAGDCITRCVLSANRTFPRSWWTVITHQQTSCQTISPTQHTHASHQKWIALRFLVSQTLDLWQLRDSVSSWGVASFHFSMCSS